MASLQGLPPLPKSLSGLLNFSSAQWKELERLHTMRTMIQQDLNRGTNLQRVPPHSDNADNVESEHGSPASDAPTQSRSGRLDVQLALLRKEMVQLNSLIPWIETNFILYIKFSLFYVNMTKKILNLFFLI